ncbi:GatB/YqeY domain-containing protein [Microlunatus sp. GCM10028923]|uniref:GatB/YqeY domain-containing protein n=1 Tax=Microlunatus sp. GCM10028923 TaxID=3273400 RepID=UPI003619B6B7
MDELRDRLQRALRSALKERDRVGARAIRTALAAIANAEAVDPGSAPKAGPATDPAVAGTVKGVGAAEVARRELSADDLAAIVGREITERRRAATMYEQSGRSEHAGELHREADVLDRILSGPA